MHHLIRLDRKVFIYLTLKKRNKTEQNKKLQKTANLERRQNCRELIPLLYLLRHTNSFFPSKTLAHIYVRRVALEIIKGL